VRNIQVQKNVLLFAVSLLFLVPAQQVYAQVSSSYLDSLEGEASGLRLDTQTKVLPQKKAATIRRSEMVQGGAISDLKEGFSVEKFEQILKTNYIGSYFFYKRLNQRQQEKVFLFYQDNPDPQKLRDKILQVTKEQ
jgi:hypothetical protein